MKITKENIEAWLLDLSEGNLSAEQEKEVRAFLRQHPELGLSADDFGDAPVIEPLPNETGNWNSIKKNAGWPRLEEEKENFLIGKLEGTLSAEEEKELNHLLLNDEKLAREWAVYRSLKLTASENEKSLLVSFLKFSSTVITTENYHDQFIIAAETGDADRLVQVEKFIKQHSFAAAEWEMVNQLKLAPVLNERMPFKEQLKKREGRLVFLSRRTMYASVAVAASVVLFFGWGWFTQNENKPVADHKNEQPANIRHNNSINNNTTQESIAPAPVADQQNTMANRIDPYNKDTDVKVVKKDSSKVVVPDVLPHTPTNNTFVEDTKNKKDSTKVNPDNNIASVTKNAFYKDSTENKSNLSATLASENTNFLTMKNMVNRVSKGFIEVDRKKDEESKEFYLRVGKLKFQRKKKLDNQ